MITLIGGLVGIGRHSQLLQGITKAQPCGAALLCEQAGQRVQIFLVVNIEQLTRPGD
jgi:hypothetical protein